MEKPYIIHTKPIGTEVWFFDPDLTSECPVQKSLVLGSFIHKTEGEVFYFLLEKQIPSYAVYETEDEARKMRDVFMLYREELLKANEENKKRFDELRKGNLFPTFTVDNLEEVKEQMYKETYGDKDDESARSANDA